MMSSHSLSAPKSHKVAQPKYTKKKRPTFVVGRLIACSKGKPSLLLYIL